MAAKTPSERALLAECAEFLLGIGGVSPDFDKQVDDLISRVRDYSPATKAYMAYCANRRDRNKESLDPDEWRRRGSPKR